MTAPPTSARARWHTGHNVWVSAGIAPAVGVHVQHMHTDRHGTIVEPLAVELAVLLANGTRPWVIVLWTGRADDRSSHLATELVW